MRLRCAIGQAFPGSLPIEEVMRMNDLLGYLSWGLKDPAFIHLLWQEIESYERAA